MRFNTRYKVYLDWSILKDTAWNDDTNANWVEVFPDIEPFKKAPFNKEMFSRYSWGQITFKNNPNLYGYAAETYNIIANAPIDQEIRIKVTLPESLVDPDSSNTIRGYFGTNDCEFDEDKGIITSTPTILDQYTDLVENWETEVPIFGEIISKKASWNLNLDISEIEYGTIHAIPVELRLTDFNEAKTPTNIFTGGVDGSIFYNSETEYSTSISIYINAEITIPAPAFDTYFLLTVIDSDDVIFYTKNISGMLSAGTISTTYKEEITIPKGHYVSVTCFILGVNTILYEDIKISLNANKVTFPTTDVTVNIQDSSLKPKDIWTEFEMGGTDYIRRSDYDSDIPTLAAYFEANGEPKDTLLDTNRYAPTSPNIRIDYKTIPELGIEVIPISGLYMGGSASDIGGLLEPYGFELSEVEVYSHFYTSGWFNTLDRARTYATCKYSRFEQYLAQGDSPGSGWTDTEHDNDNGERLWTKKPFDGTITDWELGDIDNSGGTNASIEWDAKLRSTKTYPSSGDSVILRTRDFKEIAKTVFNGTFLSLVNDEINSVFFWNDDDTAIPPVAANVNYAYPEGTENWLNKIAVAHTYQLQEINPESEDSILKISFKDFMADLKALFNDQIFWWVDIDGVLHIEHLKYIDAAKLILDLTQEAIPNTIYLNNKELLSESSSWKYDKSEMFSIVNFQIANSGNKDFNDNNITYDKIVSNKRNEDIRNTLSTKKITTDVRYCVENPSDLENGMILLNHDSLFNTVVANVPISGTDFENGNIALSNILNRYKYEGIFLSGKINDGKVSDSSVTFDVTTRTKVGKEITIKGIYDYEYFKSKLGVGRIESLTHDLDKENTSMPLRYRFGSGVVSDTFTLMISETGDFVGAEDVEFDFGTV